MEIRAFCEAAGPNSKKEQEEHYKLPLWIIGARVWGAPSCRLPPNSLWVWFAIAALIPSTGRYHAIMAIIGSDPFLQVRLGDSAQCGRGGARQRHEAGEGGAAAPPLPHKPSIAVLPFVNMQGAAD